MANPFSGLENIGQSYLAGLQLANQRQYREEAAAQRAEDTRVRGQYYQDLVDQRREAAALAAKNREDILKEKFGEGLAYEADGVTIDLVKSAKNTKSIKDLDALAAAAGKASILQQASGFSDKLEIPEELMKRPSFNQGRAEGLVSVSETRLKMPGIMASQGFAPIPDDLESAITGTKAVDFSPEMLSARTATGQPVVRPEVYEDLDMRKVYGQTYGKKTKPAKVEKEELVETVVTEDPVTGERRTRKMTRAEAAADAAKRLSQPADGLPASTNAAPVGRLSYDQNAPFGAVYTPLKY
jgi:hypothetical protein